MDRQKSMLTAVQHALITGLDAYVEYEIIVAGITSKGVGIFSSAVIQRTLGDGMKSFVITKKNELK